VRRLWLLLFIALFTAGALFWLKRVKNDAERTLQTRMQRDAGS
jgi:hypothetical protein